MTNVVSLSAHRPPWQKNPRAREIYQELQAVSDKYRRIGATDQELGRLYIGEAILLLWNDQAKDDLATTVAKHAKDALEQLHQVLRPTDGEPA